MALQSVNLQYGYPSPDAHFINERYLPAHSKTIFEDGLYKSDFSPFIGRTGDRMNLSMDTGAPICQPADIMRNAGDTNVITYVMNRGMITEALVNYRGQRIGLEEELHSDRAQVPLYTVEKLGSLGDWQGTYQTFDKEFLKVKPHMLAAWQRQVDWLFYRTLLYNATAALQVIDSSGVKDYTQDYFATTVAKFGTQHLHTARYMAQIAGVTAPSVYSKAGGKVRREQFPILLMNLMVEDFAQDPDVDTLINFTAQGGDYTTAFERLVAGYLTWDFYSTKQQNGSTGHMGHCLWPMVVWSAEIPATSAAAPNPRALDGNNTFKTLTDPGGYDGTAGSDLVVGMDTKNTKSYLEADLWTDWLRDWPQQGVNAFWLPVEVQVGPDWKPCLLKCTYGNVPAGGNAPDPTHDATTFYGVKILGSEKWPTEPVDHLAGNDGRKVRVNKGAILTSPYGYALALSSYSIIYAPAPGEAPSYTYEDQDYQTRHGVRVAGALYFGPRMTYQRAILGPIVMRFRMDYPYQVNGAALYPKLVQGGKTKSQYGQKPYVGQDDSTVAGNQGRYEKQGSAGDTRGDYEDPTVPAATDYGNQGQDTSM